MGLLRLLLAFSVVLAHSHSFYGFVGMGGFAVPAFFIISGFYMILILETKYQGLGSIGLFYSNRALRLFPMYWAVLLVFVLFAVQHGVHWPLDQIGSTARNAFAYSTDGSSPSLWAAIPNLFFLGADVLRVMMVDLDQMSIQPWIGVMEDATHRGGYQYLVAPPIWSLGVEIVYYALAPFLVLLRTRWLAMVHLALVGVQVAIYHAAVGRLGWYHLLAPYNLCYFTTGMLAFRIWPLLAPRLGGLVRPALAALPFVIWAVWMAIPTDKWTAWLLWTPFALAIPCLFQASKDWKLDSALGAYSYPIYLCHILFGWPMTKLGDWAGPAAFLLSLALSWVLIRLIDRPVEALRHRRVTAWRIAA